MTEEGLQQQRLQILAGVVQTLLEDLKNGNGDKDRRRQVEEWMRTLAEKYPDVYQRRVTRPMQAAVNI